MARVARDSTRRGTNAPARVIFQMDEHHRCLAGPDDVTPAVIWIVHAQTPRQITQRQSTIYLLRAHFRSLLVIYDKYYIVYQYTIHIDRFRGRMLAELPIDVILRIMQYLSVDDISHTVSLSGKQLIECMIFMAFDGPWRKGLRKANMLISAITIDILQVYTLGTYLPKDANEPQRVFRNRLTIEFFQNMTLAGKFR